MGERNFYVLCDDNCKFEGMTKEQILTAIDQAVSTGEIQDVDTGFVTKLKEQNTGAGLRFWVGTQAEYNALDPKPENTFCIITDDTTGSDIEMAIQELRTETARLQEQIWGISTHNIWEGSEYIVLNFDVCIKDFNSFFITATFGTTQKTILCYFTDSTKSKIYGSEAFLRNGDNGIVWDCCFLSIEVASDGMSAMVINTECGYKLGDTQSDTSSLFPINRIVGVN